MEDCMIIKRLINNNLIVADTVDSNEILVMGKGIGYCKKPGDFIEDSRIEKSYRLMEVNMTDKLQELLEQVPMKYIVLSDKMMRYIKKSYDKQVNDTLYISILDHISSALQRNEKGIHLKNPMLWDIQKFYKEEYSIGLELLQIIELETSIRLMNDEAGFLALHIVNALLESNIGEITDITNIVHTVLDIVKYQLHINFDEDSVHYFRFITHLKFFAQRLLSKQDNKGDHDGNEEMLMLVRKNHEKEYEVTFHIEDYLKKNFGYAMSDDERMYLCIHIARVINTCYI